MSYQKNKEGEVIYLLWEGTPEFLYVKGHVPPEVALEALYAEYDSQYAIDTPEPSYARWSMVNGPHEAESGLVLRDCSGPGRGNFKVMRARIL